MPAEDRYEWRYAYTGAVKHAIENPETDSGAQCGYDVFVARAWRGTGSQAEYEKAAALPKCRRCLKVIQ